jgi:hypothetical protein
VGVCSGSRLAGRVAQAFDPSGIITTAGCPVLRVLGEGRESEMPRQAFDRVSTTKSNRTRSNAAHPCKERKDGAPSAGMVHAKIVRGGPPATLESHSSSFRALSNLFHLSRRAAVADFSLTVSSNEAQHILI